MLSVRLDPHTEQALSRAAAAQGLTKSEFLRQLIDERLKKESHDATPWDLGQDRFGREGSGRGNLASNRKEFLKKRIHEKARPH